MTEQFYGILVDLNVAETFREFYLCYLFFTFCQIS